MIFNARNRAKTKVPHSIDDTIADTPTDFQGKLAGLASPGTRGNPTTITPGPQGPGGQGFERTPVPQGQREAQQASEQQRLGLPTGAQFTDPEAIQRGEKVSDTANAFSSLERAGSEIGRKSELFNATKAKIDSGGQDKRITDYGTTAVTADGVTALTKYATGAQVELQREDGETIFRSEDAKQVQAQAFNVQSQEEFDRLGTAHTIATLIALDKSRTYDYEVDAARAEGGKKSEEAAIKADAKKRKRRLRSKLGGDAGKAEETQEALAKFKGGVSQLGQEPILRSMLADRLINMDRALKPNQEAPAGSQDLSDVRMKAAADALYYDINQGILDFGHNKKGQLVPLSTDQGRALLRENENVVLAFNPEKRAQNDQEGGLIRSQAYPAHRNVYEGLQEKFSVYGNRVNLAKTGFQVSKVAANLNDNVAYGKSETRINVIQQQLEDIQAKAVMEANEQGEEVFAYSNSIWAPAVGELTQTDYNELTRKHGKDAALSIMNSKLKTAIKEQGVQQNRTEITYGKNTKSVNTGRFNETASDVNIFTSKGILRMGFAFGNVETVKIPLNPNESRPDGLDRITKRGMAAFRDLPPGEAFGWTLDKRLKAIPAYELQMLDTLYAIGRTAHNSGVSIANNATPTDGDYIQHGRDSLSQMAARGAEVAAWATGGLPVNLQSVPTWMQTRGALNAEKGEWGWDVSVYEDAANLNNFIQGQGEAIQLRHVVEHDATQSNAFIMAVMIGDAPTVAMLGAALDLPSGTWDAYGGQKPDDLRKAMGQSLDSDLDRTFADPKKVHVKEGMREFVKGMKDTHNWFKTYARGIVVAGLYGKPHRFMFSEVEDMLKKVPDLRDKLLETTYNGRHSSSQEAEKAMIKDFTELYDMSAKTHMAELLGFQNAMKKFAGIKSAVNGSSEWGGLIDGEVINNGQTQWNPRWKDNAAQLLEQAAGGNNASWDPAFTPDATDPTYNVSQLDKTTGTGVQHGYRKDDSGEYQKKGFGESSINAAPTNVIQNGDAFGLVVTQLVANMDGKGNLRDVPRNIKTIHDAVLTGAGSTLIAKNAYNNIFPWQVAKAAEGKSGNNLSYFAKFRDSIHSDVDNALDRVEEAGFASIGYNGEYPGIMQFFDKMYARISGEDIGFEVSAKDKARTEDAVMIAKGLGWLPPTEANHDARGTMVVDPNKFEELINLMMEYNKVETQKPKYLGKHGNVNWWDKWVTNVSETKVPALIAKMNKVNRSTDNLK